MWQEGKAFMASQFQIVVVGSNYRKSCRANILNQPFVSYPMTKFESGIQTVTEIEGLLNRWLQGQTDDRKDFSIDEVVQSWPDHWSEFYSMISTFPEGLNSESWYEGD